MSLDQNYKSVSASRIDSLNSCSFAYYADYVLRVPVDKHIATKLGFIVHLILEVLCQKKREPIVKKIIRKKSAFSYPSVKRLIFRHINKIGGVTQEHLASIDSSILVGLKQNFFGDKTVKKIIVEQHFDFLIDRPESGIKYRLKGFIDKIFLKKINGVEFLEVVDYKTNKDMYVGNQRDLNLQYHIYMLAITHLFPQIPLENISFQFLFLKFPENPVLLMEPIHSETLSGVEYYLTEVNKKINSFSEKDAFSNFAYDQGMPSKEEGFCKKLKCGFSTEPNELKKDGTIKFTCPYKWPVTYFAVENENGDIIESAVNLEDLKMSGQKVKISYAGCSKFN